MGAAAALQEGIQKRDVGLAGVAAQAAVGALCLWRGYREDEAAVGGGAVAKVAVVKKTT